MSKKSLTAASLEKAQTNTIRIKENYRINLTSTRDAIINETDKAIGASIRSGIKSLLINMMSDANVDLLTVSFIYDSANSNSIMDSLCDKYSIVRNGEFIQIGIDNFLTDLQKVNSLTKIVLTIVHTDFESFESICDRRQAVFDNDNGYESKLLDIYKAFCFELV